MAHSLLATRLFCHQPRLALGVATVPIPKWRACIEKGIPVTRDGHMPQGKRGKQSEATDTTEDSIAGGTYIGVNRGQRCEFKTCQQCKRPMNRRAKWSDDATWAAVKYCSDKCRKEAKRKPPTSPAVVAPSP